MNKKRSQLAIRGTLANEEWISEPHIVKNDFFTHFKKQFLPIQTPSICFDFTFPTRLSSDQVPRLEVLFTLLRGQKGCLDCGTNKSPGPYGFFFEFTRKYWTTIDDDVFQAFKKLNEMIFKVDFEKAFDSVKWDYLDKTLKAFGYGLKWRNWISSCLNNAMKSVLVNGSPTLEFQFHKGLKQALKLSHKKQIDGMVLAPNAVATAAIVDWPCSILNCSRQLSWMPRGGWSRENYGLTLLEVVELVPKYYQIDGVGL
ncbi:RNA-directed DNA polymerase, eukaryota [Tanacetum coccineum]